MRFCMNKSYRPRFDNKNTKYLFMSEQILEIQESDLMPKEKTLWLKALSAVELQNHSYAVTLCQAVLKVAPGFLGARRLARKCAVTINGGAKRKKGNAISQLLGTGGTGKLQSQSKKEPEAALIGIEKELAKHPHSDTLNNLLFDTAIRMNLLETATFALETVRQSGHGNTKLMHKLADYYLARDMPSDAASVYNDIIKFDSSDIDAVKGAKDASARASMKKDNWSESATLADVTKDTEEVASLEESDRTAMTREQVKEKLARLMNEYNEDTRNLSVSKQIAKIYEDLEYWPDSYVFYNWAYEISNKDVTLKNKAEQMRAKAANERLRELEASVSADPENAELKAELEQMKQDLSKKTLNNALKRVEQNPTDPQLRFDLGIAYYNSGMHNEAIPHLQQAKRNPHIRTRVLLTLGRSFDAKGMYDLALGQYEDALEELQVMDDTKKELLYEMGLVLVKMKKKQEAIDCFKQIYEVDYGYRDIAARVENSYSDE